MSELALPAGIHDGIPADTYHTDPAEQPSLTASIASILCQRSPRHAWAAHPRLNPDHERAEEPKYDIGTAAHALLLEGADICHVIDAADWRTKAARDARDAARESGRIPLLFDQWIRVQQMIDAVRPQLDAIDATPSLLSDGRPEQTLIWKDHGVLCRGRLDWLRDDRQAIDDLKTTAGSANPLDWASRRLWDIGADLHAAFYIRGLKALTGTDPQFRFVVVETQPPYAVSVVSLTPAALTLANEKIDWALRTWRDCLATDTWPAYTPQVAYATPPPWEETRWLEARHLEEEAKAA